MLRKVKYERYHHDSRLQKRIISENNFTYSNLLNAIRFVSISDKNILDIGCGTGTLSIFLRSKGGRVLGIDISKTAINQAKQNALRLGFSSKIKFIIKDFPKGKIKGTYDLILVTDVLEHIREDHLALKYINKLLKVNGKVILSVPLKEAPLYVLGLLKKFDKNVGHVRRYSKFEIQKLIEKCDFKIVHFLYCEGILRNSLFTNKYLSKLIRYIRWPFGNFLGGIDNILVKLLGPSQAIFILKK